MSGSSAPDPIEPSPDRRKLVAVMYADMVGYSRLIGLDDAGTLQRLRTLRSNLIDPAIEQHGGRIVQTGGDSLLVVFDSIDGAVRCAAKVQREVPAVDGTRPANESIRFRVGMSLGDAIADGTDLHGDAVNVAARLQAECPPGGICVSRSVRDHVHGRLGLEFEDLGVLNLKNIARPVEAFLLRQDTAASMPRPAERVLVQGIGEALPQPDKPSIAVLAFTNMSGDQEQEYFSDGIADDIITELSRSRSLFVIARNSSFTYKGRAVDVRQVARELGVRYVLEGSVRRNSGRVRVVAQLIETETGNHIWAERYDRAIEDVFAVQDEITAAVVTATIPAVAGAELQRLLRKPPESLGAWEAYQRGLWHMRKGTASDHGVARQFLQRAIDLDPALACGHAALAQSIMMQNVTYGALPVGEVTQLAFERAHVAIEIDPSDADAQAIMAFALWTAGDFREAWQRAEIALANNPNSPQANGVKAALLIFDGRPREGREAAFTTLRLNPHDLRAAHLRSQIAISYYFDGDYLSACEAAKNAIAHHPKHPLAYRWLAASLGQLGHAEDASDALQTAIAMSSRTFELQVRSCPPWFRLEDHEHMLEGLRKAGWQG